MKTLIGGAIAAVLGLIGLAIWVGAFLQLLAGAIPIMLLLGGGLALYLGFDEIKDNWKNKKEEAKEAVAEVNETEQYKSEIESLKKEMAELKAK